MADDLLLFVMRGGEGSRIAPLEPGNRCQKVLEGGRTFMAAWRREEERAAELRRKYKEEEEAGKVPIARDVTGGKLRRFW